MRAAGAVHAAVLEGPEPTWHSGPVTDDRPRLGFGLPVSGGWATRDTVVRVARRAEELGYASLWAYQRTLWPADGRLGSSHRSVLDPVVALSLAAGHTERIGLGTATVCAPFTAPALLASTMASLDVVSGGRLTVGVGMGWLPEEHVAAGIPMERRGARFEEYLRCLRALWTQEPVEFSGEFYTVPRSYLSPRPVQQPHPPVVVGAAAEPALRRAGRLAQGWIASSRQDPGDLARRVAMVREGAREAGRDPTSLRILVRVVPDLVDQDPGPERPPLRGTRDQILADVRSLGSAGATEILLDLNLSPRVGTPDVDAGAALVHADRLLEALAPGAGVRHIVVMGVSGCGKSALARLLADRLGYRFIEADEAHPQANIDAMSRGIPLTDEDRWPWLEALAERMAEETAAGRSTVMACSALKRSYRDVLRRGGGERLAFVHLDGDPDLIAGRIDAREHFMPGSLLHSQVSALEPLGPDEVGVRIDLDQPLEAELEQALTWLERRVP